ncbi:ester cyclase [Halobellus rufus]|uniref:ester cyclase n=1 Tax=Halobellus rufus TaxID=1448860 RepID=UPI000679E731|nr:ester cyclase [Halobellus rufus]
MGAQENKAMVRRIIDEAWNDQDLDVVDELYSEDYTGHWYLPEGRESDRETLKGFMSEVFEGFPDYQMNVEFVIAEGEYVTVGFTGRGSHEGEFMGIPPGDSETPYNPTPGHITFRIEDGRVVEGWSTWDALGLLQDMGALPDDLSAMAPAADD